MLECIGAHLRRAARQKEEFVMAMMNNPNLDDGNILLLAGIDLPSLSGLLTGHEKSLKVILFP